VLKAWEQKSKDIKTFDANFTRWEYDPVFPKPNADPKDPVNVDFGILKYAAPDKGVFRILSTVGPDGKAVPIEADRADHWICDGKSVYQYLPKQKQLVEHKLPPEMQGKAIVDGPLPFLFGADAQKLRQRYWIRIVLHRRIFRMWSVLRHSSLPTGCRQLSRGDFDAERSGHDPQGVGNVSAQRQEPYLIYVSEAVFNDPLHFFQGNPFQAYTPRGWEKIVDDAAAQQAGRPGGKSR